MIEIALVMFEFTFSVGNVSEILVAYYEFTLQVIIVNPCLTFVARRDRPSVTNLKFASEVCRSFCCSSDLVNFTHITVYHFTCELGLHKCRH